jgi:hypothetical protein
VGEVLLPFLINVLFLLAVLMLYAVIGLKLDINLKLSAFGVFIFIISCILLFIGQSANVIELSARALETKKKTVIKVGMKKFLKSCPLLKVHVGPFFPLGKSTVTSVLQNILECTVTFTLL